MPHQVAISSAELCAFVTKRMLRGLTLPVGVLSSNTVANGGASRASRAEPPLGYIYGEEGQLCIVPVFVMRVPVEAAPAKVVMQAKRQALYLWPAIGLLAGFLTAVLTHWILASRSSSEISFSAPCLVIKIVSHPNNEAGVVCSINGKQTLIKIGSFFPDGISKLTEVQSKPSESFVFTQQQVRYQVGLVAQGP